MSSNELKWPTPEPRPVDLETALLVMGNLPRAEVLRYLDTVPSATRQMIQEGTQLAESTLAKALKYLLLHECVVITNTARRGSGHNFLYAKNKERVAALEKAWHQYTSPSSASIGS